MNHSVPSTSATPVVKERPDGSTPSFAFSTSYPFIQTSKKNRYYRWAFYMLLALLVTVAILTPMGFFTKKANDAVSQDSGQVFVTPRLRAAGCDPLFALDPCSSLIDRTAIITVVPAKFDPSKGLSLIFAGSISSAASPGLVATEVKIEVDTKTHTIPVNSLGTFTFTSVYGVKTDPSFYPFEFYEIQFDIIVSSLIRQPDNTTALTLFDIALSAVSPFQVPSFKMNGFELDSLRSDYGSGRVDALTTPGVTVKLSF
ncbi:hypothetical protein HDU67_000326, partial [Dinochytrium kinnereticum]